MKKVISILIIVSLCSFKTQTDKKVTVEFSKESLIYHMRNINGIKKVIDNSDLNHKTVISILNALDSLQNEIYTQVKDELK